MGGQVGRCRRAGVRYLKGQVEMQGLVGRVRARVFQLFSGDYKLIAASPELFHPDFYRLMYGDVAASGVDPILHYLTYGAHEGRDPSPVFNTLYYANQMPAASQGMNPLVHFLRHGLEQEISPTPFFDHRTYAKRNRDVAEQVSDLFMHYAKYGVHENRVASDMFDPQRYLKENQDAQDSNLHGLAHYLIVGEGRGALPVHYEDIGQRKEDGVHITYPSDFVAEIKALRPQDTREAVVDVIVPVYRAFDETLSCLWHVLKARDELQFELVVVDDCSPEPELSKALLELAESGHITLLRNKTNAGFVKTVNRGMRLNTDRDVVLLNSDTEVYSGWIDRLYEQAQRDPLIGTLTPLTNNGTICSYPHFPHDNPHSLEIGYEEIDEIARTVNADVDPVPAPTGVGFAMYIKREVLEAVGYFDEEAFGTGYGEENDFCQRAQAAGWLDMITSNVFIRHLGSMSFQEQKAGRIRHAENVINTRYPKYHDRVQRFIEADPLRSHRARIDEERLLRLSRNQNILVISHGRGGGTEQATREYCDQMVNIGVSAFRMRVDIPNRDRVAHFHAAAEDLPNLPTLSIDGDCRDVIALWRRLGIDRVDIHHQADFGRFGAERLLALLEVSGIPWRYVIHDYLLICPRFSLAGANAIYCGEPDAAGCKSCLKANHSEFGIVDINRWRADNHALLQGAEACVVPDRDVGNRLQKYFPGVEFQIVPHDSVVRGQRPKNKGSKADTLRIGVIGAISELKGFSYLVDCANYCRSQNLRITFFIVGFTSNDQLAKEAGIQVTGKYNHANLQERLSELKLDAILQPVRIPETYSYTLSAAIESGLPILVFDIGAPQSRLRSQNVADAHILPMNTSPKQMADYLYTMF